CRLYGFKW
nr:Chain D, P7C8 [synthetic construct]